MNKMNINSLAEKKQNNNFLKKIETGDQEQKPDMTWSMCKVEV